MKRCLALLLILSALLPLARAESPDDQYVRIYNTMQEADALNSGGKPTQALTKYLEAQTALDRFRKIYPEWNPKVVSFRLNYLGAKVTAVSAAVPPPAVASAQSATNAVSSAHVSTNALDTQLNSLRDQVRQMQVDKIVLEAKLKESLAAQPASTDPRELAKAEERIKSLQKENALLKINLNQSKTNASPIIDAKTVQATQQALAESNRKLAEETEKANALALEKTALQQKLDNLAPTAWNAAALDTAKKALEQTNRQLAREKELAIQTAAERDRLQQRLASLTAEADAAAALRSENQILKKQLSDLRSASPSTTKTAESGRQLAAAQAQIATLQSDKDILRLEKLALEARVKQLAMANNRAPSVSKPEDLARIKQLERDRDELQKKLEIANKELAGRNNKGDKGVASHILDMENQMATLRARLEVFEARAVPYTAEELALFKRPEIDLAAQEANTGKKSVKALPEGAAVLVADAQRFFSEKQFDKAEEKYLQVLRQDDKNVPTLANLATIQIERNHLDDAEKHIKQAVTLAPDDAYSWLVLGQLKFRQEKYDDALDALGRAAKLDPQDAQIQNYLGITLSQKGLRGPAETALRKAIQLDPGNASAHHNLAVVYLTQKPPLVELAKWHYQKALAGGHPRNPEVERLFDGQQTAAAAAK